MGSNVDLNSTSIRLSAAKHHGPLSQWEGEPLTGTVVPGLSRAVKDDLMVRNMFDNRMRAQAFFRQSDERSTMDPRWGRNS